LSQLEDEIGDIVSKARRGLGISLKEAAERANLSEDVYALIESCRLIPDAETLVAIACTLRLNPDKLKKIAGGWTPKEPNLTTKNASIELIPTTFGVTGEARLGDYIQNCFLLKCSKTSTAAVIDPGGNIEGILQSIQKAKAHVEIIMITHAHHDHTGGIKDLVKNLGKITIAAHKNEIPHIQMQRDKANKLQTVPVSDGAEIMLGNLVIKALHTPGHTEGSLCYATDRFCFVGDTLFAGSIGSSTVYNGYPEMLNSICDKILSMPDETIILPGHGPITTVGEEKQHNPFFSK